jgi:RimJ/RimL family protein N-acetyltransferase
MPMIMSENLRLRAIEREDIPRFVRWLNDPEVVYYLLHFAPISKASEEKWFERQMAMSPTEGQIFAIEVKEGDAWVHIGDTGLHQIDMVTREAEFGIFIGEKKYWNQGYGRQATQLTVKYGFESLNLNRIFLYAVAENIRGLKAYEASGFVKEGLLRQALFKNGKYNDIIVMSVLHSEWKGSES